MKLLNDLKQIELQHFFNEVVEGQYLPVGLAGQAKYWQLELKSKRPRRNKVVLEESKTVSRAQREENEIPSNNVVDN